MERINRRDVLKGMAWAGGGGMVWSLVGGVPRGAALGSAQAAELKGALNFVQLSDTHVGFAKDANPDALGTARQAVARINALAERPAFVLHTGDVTHLSKPAEFDAAQQLLAEIAVGPVHCIPGEHDVLDDPPGALFRDRLSKGSLGDGWYSFDQGGAHFIGLVNVLAFGATGQGQLGAEQLAWVDKDLAGVADSTPVIVFAHIPLWSVYEPWGWSTADAAPLFAALRRFGSVTVLNGHIHQVIQKVEGNVAFHSAMSTAYPQPRPGDAPSPGPLKVPADRLTTLLGVREVTVSAGRSVQPVTDFSLAKG